MDLVEIKDENIFVDKNIAISLRNFYKQKALMDIQEKKLKKELKEAMLKNNIEEWAMELENGVIKAKIKSSYIRKTVDTEKLKQDGLYDKYTKETPVAESLQLEIC